MVMHQKEVSAQYTQANRKESLRSHSSEGQKAPKKTGALFSSEQGDLIRSSETLVRRIWEDLFLKVTRITCSIRQDQTWRKNFMSNLSISASMNYQWQTEEQRLASQEAQYGFVGSRREQVRLQEELSLKENSPKYSNPKYAWNGRNWQSARISRRWSLSAKVQKKSRDSSTAHFPIAANARTDEFYEWFWRRSRCGIKILWKVVSRFQPTCDDFDFSFLCQPRQEIAAWHMESIWITGKRFWKPVFYVWFTQRSSKNSIWRRPRSSRWSRKDEDYSHKWRPTKSRHNPNFYVEDSIRWYLGTSVQIENTSVRATLDCIGIVRHGNQWNDIDAQLSEIEEDGEEKYRSETPIAKLWRQTRQNRNRSSGQWSKGLKLCWKRKRYLLPVER